MPLLDVRSITSRREFVQRLAAATTATLLLPEPFSEAGTQESLVVHPVAKADSIIVLWMAGGMAAPDTFDPKKYKPFEVGLAVPDVISTFPSIPTAVDAVRICQGLEEIASVLDRATLIRSHVQPDLGSILHSRHQYHWHTGYVPPQTVACPHIGAWMARVLGPRNPVMPAFINIGQRLEGIGENEEIKAFTTAGFFGSEFGPMNLPFPEEAARAVQPPKGMDPGRFSSRYSFFKKLVRNSPARDYISDYHQESMLRSLDNAHRLLGAKEREAFDITREPNEVLKQYDTGRFGRGCLLARRLVENGARYVEVTTEYIPFVHWDTHDRGHETLTKLKKEIDRPIATLIRDLEIRGLLDRTLVVIASEFSRDMITEGQPGSKAGDQANSPKDFLLLPNHYGQHRHFTGGSTVVMFGGGVKKGFVYGKTADERPCMAVEHPVSVSDLHATLFSAMGMSPKTVFDIEGRPFYATDDGKGKPIDAIFS
ncbi:MAG: DUF1501 domain-containing protein [Planctomycetota bacterium]|nr:MAG: DUF1501 domain-containing protein [Planctomycetota bacterium]